MNDQDDLLLSDVPPFVAGSDPRDRVLPGPPRPPYQGVATAMGAAAGAALGSPLGPMGASVLAGLGAGVGRRAVRRGR